jgi:thioredoxin-like negative regulator of GroEL
MKPVVDGLQPEYEGVVEFRLINAETDPEGAALMQEFRAQYVPTFVFVSADGQVVDQIVGAVEESVLVEKLDAL